MSALENALPGTLRVAVYKHIRCCQCFGVSTYASLNGVFSVMIQD